ncbi:hypothetical protein [Pseudoduganella umbonata]|uniref:Uncharacterized protein n=1 Tax=Pseudoduganella umbonata TaxID=864828 RepID=A0A4P8HQ14_9BURK|nr:hypothetical protein [Pseudoduganella umbonata]MBB3220689.1 hypothetical protein [Pseudoduganella umbonata]QCP11829.1 hypothetical protein FCL38_16425 [Pseudoduganella umbonata]
MKDHVLLLAVALASASVAWAFWHFLGPDALDVLVLVALTGTIADNWRLRRALQRCETKNEGGGT